MSHQNVVPASQAAIDDSRPKAANLTCMMAPGYNEADLYGGSRIQGAGEHSHELSNLAQD
jgi:hypothetical protein